MAFTLFGKSGLASVLTTGKTGIAAALTVSAGAAIGAGTLIKNDAGEPLISSLMSAPPQVEAPMVPDSGQKAEEPSTSTEESEQVASLSQEEQGEEVVAAQDPPGTPRFDILRVEPDGSVVVAGSAPPDSAVEILAGEKVVGKGKAGASGDFAIVFDKPLPAGDHELVIRALPQEGEPVLSAETGIVSIPAAGDEGGEVLAMVSRDGAASRILQGPGSEPVPEPEPEPEQVAVAEPVTEEPVEAAAEEPAEPVAEEPAKPAKPVAPVLVQAVDVEKDRLFVAGKGEPGAKVRIYIDGDFKGEATVAPQGTFLLELAQGLESGRHQLRADMLEGGGSTVSSRAQVAVDHEPEPPQQVAQTEEPEVETPQVAAVETPEPAKPVEAVETPVVEESAEEPVQTAATETVEEPVITTGRSVIIRRGDNLWRISRRMLGEGRRYTLIFEANTDQIRNPDLIYPGQVFEVPGEEDTAGTAQSSSG
ncbi:MAG: LysM peptidoglycan-binding domain-containing protein [Nitratireductor sp.]|nr:LysM peptidoglycan-binding domain-containing protein [Nitratireductor sp.]